MISPVEEVAEPEHKDSEEEEVAVGNVLLPEEKVASNGEEQRALSVPDDEFVVVKKKKKSKKKKQKKARTEQHLMKIMKECENAATTLELVKHSTERRKSSNISNPPPVENKENSPPGEDVRLEREFQEEYNRRRIDDLPWCNAFKGDVNCAQILCIAIECFESQLLYKCVGPECSYKNNDPCVFAHHVSSLHRNVVWNGDCPICFETVIMDGQLDLIDALAHLMKQHLTNATTEVIHVDLSDDEDVLPPPSKWCTPFTKSTAYARVLSIGLILFLFSVEEEEEEAEKVVEKEQKRDESAREPTATTCQVEIIEIDADNEEPSLTTPTPSTNDEVAAVGGESASVHEPQTPRLRVRRLSGDLLSGTPSSECEKHII
jgi:hypothetical protein